MKYASDIYHWIILIKTRQNLIFPSIFTSHLWMEQTNREYSNTRYYIRKTYRVFKEKFWRLFSKDPRRVFFLTRVMEALNRESLRAFLYGMDVGDCATIGNDSAEGGGNGSRFWFGSAVVKYFRTLWVTSLANAIRCTIDEINTRRLSAALKCQLIFSSLEQMPNV